MKLFAIFGDPVAHSRSPLMHNHVFKSLGFKGCYTRIQLKDGSKLRETFFEFGLSGANITVPHKEAAFSACDEIRGFAKKIGVVNTIIYEDGKSKHKRIPLSKYKNNCTERRVSYEILKDGSIKGKAHLSFKGNDNLSIRSSLKDASRNDMKKILERVINANTPDLTIDSLVYDDPSTIEKTFNITIFFSKDQIGSTAGDLFIFKPNIFVLEPELDRFRDEKREFAVRYYAPFSVIDDVEINFDDSIFKIKSPGKVIRTNYSFASFSMVSRKKAPGKICIRRDFNIKKMNISAGCYKDFRKLHKSIAAANNENIVLEYKR